MLTRQRAKGLHHSQKVPQIRSTRLVVKQHSDTCAPGRVRTKRSALQSEQCSYEKESDLARQFQSWL